MPLFDVAVDVLQHDDGIVDHQADGQHQRQQRQRVDGEAEPAPSARRPDQADSGIVTSGMMRRPQVAQEDENHQHHQHHRLADGLVDRLTERSMNTDES
jgi:hypothetical protein